MRAPSRRWCHRDSHARGHGRFLCYHTGIIQLAGTIDLVGKPRCFRHLSK